MTDHTPTPWEISPTRTVEDTAMIVGGEGFEFGLIADVTEDFDAAFIVKAANNHDALVKALQVLLDEATSFGVSGVYFDEDCMGHKGPTLARQVLDIVGRE